MNPEQLNTTPEKVEAVQPLLRERERLLEKSGEAEDNRGFREALVVVRKITERIRNLIEK